MPKLLRISSDCTFFSFQGEGATIGYPAVFLRLQGCNLRCQWCDTAYGRAKTASGSKSLLVKDVTKQIIHEWNSNCLELKAKPRLIITGGEPLLQLPAIEELIRNLSSWHIEIETNATIKPSVKLLKRCQINCSPKLSNSGNLRSLRMNPIAINSINRYKHWFKFVVQRKNDVLEIEKDFIKPFHIAPERVILVPQGWTVKEIRKHAANIAIVAKEHGYRIITRMHIILWGNKRRT